MTTPAEGRRGKILVLLDYYHPGQGGGGAVKSVRNLVRSLAMEYEIRIVTRGNDLGKRTAYPGISEELWYEVDGAGVRYLAASPRRALRLFALLRRARCEILYLNSFFSPLFSILPLVLRRLRLLPAAPVVLAPRGELLPGALALKGSRKRTYLRVARALDLHRGVIWQASSAEEERSFRRWFPNAEIHIGEDIPVHEQGASRAPKKADSLRVLFLSRIARNKNLDLVIRVLGSVTVPVRVTIAGPVKDEEYWRRCRESMRQLPESITVEYVGPIDPARVGESYGTHDVLFLPTLGENYGWVIDEALAAGCPVLISDRTPWRNLAESGVGWDLPLGDEAAFARVLEEVYRMGPEQHGRMSARASAWVRERDTAKHAAEAQRGIFERALRSD